MQFKDLNLLPSILRALEKENYKEPTPIQEQAIPTVLNGRDLLGIAQTGTGKTAAFAIPTMQLILESRIKYAQRKIRTLVITPTRELALQIFESYKTYGHFTNLKYSVIYGGVSQRPQEIELKKGVDIVIATPGRLNDLINQKVIDLKQVETLVLDEADQMLDMGFIHDIKKIISNIPQKRQTLFFSATMPSEIIKLSKSILVNPIKVEITPESTTVDTIEQKVYFVDKENKKHLLIEILKDKAIRSVIVFSRTKHGADKIVRELNKANVSAQAIHGNKSQNYRQAALKNFKSRSIRVLVATDVAARGIDIDEVTHVINYDLPNVSETYVHRIGRTGRAGLSGIAISFCDEEEKAYLKDIEKLINKKIPVINDHPYPLTVNLDIPKPKITKGKTYSNVKVFKK
jgi:ATP-dependent RNA helicase RhlE